ncbi:trypsin-like peptidase domain-containing protein [Catellatospora vulcania]|uniref:trypsin-like peptidase domain-containing protein n=1 Tax=Catellatospora vulcania TaxID=1460450 RepID=UPI001E5ECFF6|nr:trypsin-like peptidase domain-containing protein [Catellatospora vulcania]
MSTSPQPDTSQGAVPQGVPAPHPGALIPAQPGPAHPLPPQQFPAHPVPPQVPAQHIPAQPGPAHAPGAYPPAPAGHPGAVPAGPYQAGPVPGPFPPAPAPGPFPPATVGHPPQPWPAQAVPPVPMAYPLPPHPASALPVSPGGPARQGRLRRILRFNTVLAVLLAVLIGLVAWQNVRIGDLSEALAGADQRLSDLQRADAGRLEEAESRLGALEKEVGGAFNVEKLAAAVLPSVFRVDAGPFSGTAFAVGPKASDGGTNLFTNFHVVEALYKDGGRTVKITRDGKRFDAKIVGVNKLRDVAHLHTTAKFTGLTVAKTPAKPGQQIIAVGAPLGLTDTVTSGVVSAIRESGYEEGPMVQFDAAINPGNSGGPVINGQQQVVGITVAGYLNAEGLGLAIPIADACKLFTIC